MSGGLHALHSLTLCHHIVSHVFGDHLEIGPGRLKLAGCVLQGHRGDGGAGRGGSPLIKPINLPQLLSSAMSPAIAHKIMSLRALSGASCT